MTFKQRPENFEEVLAEAIARGLVRTTVAPDGRTMIYIPPDSPWANDLQEEMLRRGRLKRSK
jgi:hypothetical protein